MSEQLICKNPKCGKPFIKTWCTQVYCCKDCRDYMHRRWKSYSRKSLRQKIKNKYGSKPRLSLEEANALARAEGLTYGQYFNRHGYDGWF